MSLAKDSAILLGAEGVSAGLTVATGLLVARLLSVEHFGLFTAAFAFAGLLAVAADSGMGLLVAKEIARGGDDSERRLRQIFTWRILMIGAACAAGPSLAPLALPAGEARALGAWMAPGAMLFGLADFFGWFLRGARRARAAAALQVGSRALLLALCAAALWQRRTPGTVIAAFWITGLVVALVAPAVIARGGLRLRFERFGAGFFKGTLPDIYKIGAVVILSVAFTRLDLLLVTGLLGAGAAGFFGAGGRIVDALRLVPTAANSALLPRFSALVDHPADFHRQFRSAYAAMLALSVAIALSVSAAAEPILARLLGESYRGAAPVLVPLAWSAVPMFLNMAGFAALYALHDQRTLIGGIAAALVVELSLNAWALPRYGVAAAGWSRLAAETVNWAVITRAVLSRGLFSTGGVARAALAARG